MYTNIWHALRTTEYIVLRLVRRFLFPYSLLLKFGNLIPFFRVNSSQDAPLQLVDAYECLVKEYCPEIVSRVDFKILEIGAGVTNTVGMLLAERFCCNVDVCDPFVHYDQASTADAIVKYRISVNSQHRTRRVEEPEHSAYDLILSNSVLEHVRQPELFFAQMNGALRDGGVMIHRVDYRDHFFKYPYHFLMFSSYTWDTFLNPGDLYRWRLDDHLKAGLLEGLCLHVVEENRLYDEYQLVKNAIRKEYLDMPYHNVSSATILITNNQLGKPV